MCDGVILLFFYSSAKEVPLWPDPLKYLPTPLWWPL